MNIFNQNFFTQSRKVNSRDARKAFIEDKFFNFLIMYEHFYICPYCWENISALLDSSVREQTYIEDCEVCCNPIELHVVFEEEELMGFEAINIDLKD